MLLRSRLPLILAPLLLTTLACSGGENPAEEPAAGSGGTGAVAGAGGTTPGAGGATGGSAGSGGSGVAGSSAGSGGSGGSAGSVVTAGSGGGEAVGGAGGAPQGGSAGESGSTSAGAGGSAGSGDAGMSGAAGSAGGGSAGTGGGGECAAVPSIADSTCTVGESNCFSFFVASRARMFALAEAFNGSTKGWGGDFRYGTGDGLTGADKLCTEIAEQSLPGNCRTWRAFLSTSKVNAIDRVGSGPWYDRLNRTIANNLTELAQTRPGGITVSSILNNLPNEDGTPHHNEEVGCENLNQCADNHDVLTGSDREGKVCTPETCMGIGSGGGFPGGPGGQAMLTDLTCEDWTLGTSKAGVAPRCGHTWPTGGGFGGGMMGGGDHWISHLTENGCAPGFNLVQNGGPMPDGMGSVGDGGGYGAIYCLALSD